MTSRRPKIAPLKRTARGYAADDPRYERNARVVSPSSGVKARIATRGDSDTGSSGSTGTVNFRLNGSTIGGGSEVDFIAGDGVGMTGSTNSTNGAIQIVVNATPSAVVADLAPVFMHMGS